jgi:hypothetical protein
LTVALKLSALLNSQSPPDAHLLSKENTLEVNALEGNWAAATDSKPEQGK